MAATGGAEARAALGRMEEYRASLRRGPSPWAEIEAFRSRLERLMAEFEGATPRQRKAFQRELEEFYSLMERRSREGKWAPKHLKIMGIALRDARRLHFPNARKVLKKLDKPLDLYARWREATEEYRRLYRAMQQDLEDLRRRRGELKAIPKPPMAPEESSATAAQVREYNSAATDFLRALTLRRSPTEVQEAILQASQNPTLRLPQPEDLGAAEALLAFLRERPAMVNVLPTGGIAGLLELARFSDAKLAHLAPGAMDLRRLVVENQSWLKAILESPGRALTIPWSDDVTRELLEGLQTFLGIWSEAEGLRSSVATIQDHVASGLLARAREAEALYARHGDVARRRWEGTLGKDIEELEGRISELKEVLDGLPTPEAAPKT